MRKIDKIILHCSDSDFGDKDLIDGWHSARGWDGIGYHYVILNGHPSDAPYRRSEDGVIEIGRDVDEIGAHCYGENKDSIGISLVGRNHFTPLQLFVALPLLLSALLKEHGLGVKDIFGHGEFNSKKTCPNMDMKVFRENLSRTLY
ncbi:MAG: N-acetylmuramoyl-L-alanine amidase [Deltaproteobacteria bacterium]|nr:N-acetylmuramoyl-L-alanine amidase [Deltaproteobacteria bacterium]